MIICLGLTPAVQRTMLFDRFALDQVNRAAETIESAAGKSVNVARVLRFLGETHLALGVCGGDTGQNLLRYLDAEGVAHDFVPVEPRTRICTTLVDRATRQVTELVEESQDIGPAALAEVLHRLRRRIDHADLLILSGSLTPGAPATFYRDCVRLAKEQRVPVIVDAAGPPLAAALPVGVDLVKPNRAELERTVGIKADSPNRLKEAMVKLIGMGARSIVVTLGAEGAVGGDGERFWKVGGVNVEVVNPIGSGDAFTAGMAAALVHGDGLDAAMQLASACATANVKTNTSALVRPSDVQQILPRLQIKPM